jgi:FlaG/FlaF family flagellin (archaellin)
MSRRVLIITVVVAALLATLVAPAAATSLEAGDAASVQTEASSGLGGRSLVLPLPIQPAGEGGCGGAGSCPT